MAPVIGRCVARIDASGLNRIDRTQHLFDLGPARQCKQAFAARLNIRAGCEGFAWVHGAQDIDRRKNRAIVVGIPADESEHTARPQRLDALRTADDLLIDNAAKAQPMLAFLRHPGDMHPR